MTFKERWEEALYSRVAVTPAVPQFRADLTGVAEDAPVYSDIVLHLPVLQWFASHCDLVTEFGVRNVVSTLALLAGARKKVTSYDVTRTPAVDEVLAYPDLPVPWEFIQQSSLEAPRAYTDMLFIDTIHSGTQVRAELARHADFVTGYIAFHDTKTFADYDGYLRAIRSFYETEFRPEWKLVYETELNNGLIVLKRVTSCY